jgi:peptide/nickel transport system permease protein
MKRFLLRRLLLALVTLFLLTLVVFFATHVLPGNVGQRILGPLADKDAVALKNKELGTDKPIPTQYVRWLADLSQGDLGISTQYSTETVKVQVTEKLRPALGYSARLAMLAFVLVVPISILGGIAAALRRGKALDRVISVGGLSLSVVPEFVWAVLLIVIFPVKLGWLSSFAAAPEGASVFTQYVHLLLPAMCLVMVLFGYIARITRAGVIEALDADYVRTAELKGLTKRQVVIGHVLRNALLPTIAVVATQVGYLLGGLVGVELIFNYQGFGQLLINSVRQLDFPVLQAAVLISGAFYIFTTFVADVLYTMLNPRIRQGVLG